MTHRVVSGTYLALQPLLIWARALVTPVDVGVRAVAQDPQGRILLVRHSYVGGWHFPGGGVDRGEAPADAVLRELREETGLLRSSQPELIGAYVRSFGWATNLILLYRLIDVEIAFKPNVEIREAIFVPADSLPPGTSPGVRRRTAEFFRGAPPSTGW